MDHKLPTELQRGAVHGMILFSEGHVLKVLGNSFVPFGIHHKFILIGVGGSSNAPRKVYWQLPCGHELGLVMILTID
jgi:hypothetical protein